MVWCRGVDPTPGTYVHFSAEKFNGKAVIVRVAHNRAMNHRPYTYIN